MIGKKFTRLTVIGRAPFKKSYRMWKVRCKCGIEKIVRQSNLKNGAIKSCGCLQREIARKTISKVNNITHGMSRSQEYRTWQRIKQRCYHKKFTNYKNYGGRGIRVCKRWLDSFENFFADMGLKPSSKHSIDRINNNGNYELNNCKWSTSVEQNNNRRKRKRI